MSQYTEQIISFMEDYMGEDFFAENELLLTKYKDVLNDDEIREVANYYSFEGGYKAFLQFVEMMNLRFTLEESLVYLNNLFSCYEEKKYLYIVQSNLFYSIEKMKEITIDSSEKYYEEALLLSVKRECIFVIQKILETGLNINKVSENILELIKNMDDVQLKDYLKYYIRTGKFKEDCEIYFEYNGAKKYIPQYEQKVNDYFETEGLEDMERLLKSYNHENLLQDNTSTEELRKFIENEYNWDDGVAIPYFIMKHKNCSLNLKKELFELGAGDCLDHKEHSIYGKDPWERFIIELDEMIQSEEKGL